MVAKGPCPPCSFISRNSTYHVELLSWVLAEVAFLNLLGGKTQSCDRPWNTIASQEFLSQEQMNEQADILTKSGPCLQKADGLWQPPYASVCPSAVFHFQTR